MSIFVKTYIFAKAELGDNDRLKRVLKSVSDGVLKNIERVDFGGHYAD